jgi:hypothetical protein
MPKKKKQARPKKSAKKPKKFPKTTAPKRKVARKRAASRRSLAGKKKFSTKRRRLTSTGLVVEAVPLPSGERREHLDGQAGDLQGLSNRPMANSESVEELLEEGNALESEAVQGVENALDADKGGVETHEVPEDDVPQEYQDKDR